jgi:hypothetical protein
LLTPAQRLNSPRLPPDVVASSALVLAFLGLLWCWPVVPSQDYPAWVYEGAFLNAAWRGPVPNGCHFVDALPPNALVQIIVAVLSFVMSPDAAGRLYVSACVALLAAALVYLLRARDPSGRNLATLVCLPLFVSYPVFHGFLNYLAALPILCFGVGYLLRQPEAPGWRGSSMLVLVPLLAYCCHGTALGVWGVVLLVQLWVGRSARFARRAAIGCGPMLILVLLYTSQRLGEGAHITWLNGSFVGTLSYRLRSPFRFFGPFQGLLPTFDDPWLRRVAPLLVATDFLYVAAISFMGICWAWRARRSTEPSDRLLSGVVLVLLAVFLLLPHDVAKMLNPAERLCLPIAFFAAAGLAAPSGAPQRRWLRRLCSLLVLAQLGYLAIWGTQAALAGRDYLRAWDRFNDPAGITVVPTDAIAMPLTASTGAVWLLTRHQVLAQQGMLRDWPNGKLEAPFDTGLFRCPLLPLRSHQVAALRAADAPERTLMLIGGDTARANAIAEALAPIWKPIASGPGFVTLRR